MRRLFVLVFAVFLVPFQPAFGESPNDTNAMVLAAADQETSSDLPPRKKPHHDESEDVSPAMPETRPPSLLAFGMSSVNFDKDEPKARSMDFRLEYRWGYALWDAHGSWMDFGIHPLVGGLASTRGQLYGFGGFAFDWVLFKHFVITESEAVGLFDSGSARPLGSVIEFRSQIEAGWRFDNDIRITAQASHISNAGITHRNPGQEMAGGYIYIPVGKLCSFF